MKRSTTNGGPYATCATNVTGTTYTNTGLTNGTTYYYVVTAVNASGESPVSTQVSATPSARTGGDTRRRDRDASGDQRQPVVQRAAGAPRATRSPITAMTVTVVVQRTTGRQLTAASTTPWAGRSRRA